MKNKFSWRAFISFGLTYSFLIILISGIILYIAPPGRYAHWVNWTLWRFTKEAWQSLHTIFSIAFVVLSIFHLFSINWKAFLSYLRTKAQEKTSKKKELIAASIMMVAFFFGTSLSIPPFSSVMELSENLTGSWEKAEETPPIPHAELLTLEELDEQIQTLSLEDIKASLASNKIEFENTSTQTLKEIAAKNNLTPQAIYEKLTHKPTQMQGAGIGRKSLETICTELQKNTDEVILLLEDNDIIADKAQNLREIAEENEITPKEIYELIEAYNNIN